MSRITKTITRMKGQRDPKFGIEAWPFPVHDNERCADKSLCNYLRCRSKFEAVYTGLVCIYGFSDFDNTFCFFPYKNRWSSDHLCILLESHFFLGLAGIRDKELLSEFIHAEFSDHILCSGISHKFHKSQ